LKHKLRADVSNVCLLCTQVLSLGVSAQLPVALEQYTTVREPGGAGGERGGMGGDLLDFAFGLERGGVGGRGGSGSGIMLESGLGLVEDASLQTGAQQWEEHLRREEHLRTHTVDILAAQVYTHTHAHAHTHTLYIRVCVCVCVCVCIKREREREGERIYLLYIYYSVWCMYMHSNIYTYAYSRLAAQRRANGVAAGRERRGPGRMKTTGREVAGRGNGVETPDRVPLPPPDKEREGARLQATLVPNTSLRPPCGVESHNKWGGGGGGEDNEGMRRLRYTRAQVQTPRKDSGFWSGVSGVFGEWGEGGGGVERRGSLSSSDAKNVYSTPMNRRALNGDLLSPKGGALPDGVCVCVCVFVCVYVCERESEYLLRGSHCQMACVCVCLCVYMCV
jgi:hypothetical protein